MIVYLDLPTQIQNAKSM